MSLKYPRFYHNDLQIPTQPNSREYITQFEKSFVVTIVPDPSTITAKYLFDFLPSWARTIRPHQIVAIRKVVEAFYSGERFVILDAPTGSGKSLIGYILSKLITPYRSLYLTHSKSLQDQFHIDFPQAAILKGRSNYIPIKPPTIHHTCADCIRKECTFCPGGTCPYMRARSAFDSAILGMTNYSYFLTKQIRSSKKLSPVTLAICDEADTLESALLDTISTTIPKRLVNMLGIEPPSRKTVPSAWPIWAVETAKQVKEIFEKKVTEFEAKQPDPTTLSGIQELRNLEQIESLLYSIEKLKTTLSTSPESFVYTGYDKGHIEFKPINVAEFTQDLWGSSTFWLFMSATVISADALAFEELGIPTDPRPFTPLSEAKISPFLKDQFLQ